MTYRYVLIAICAYVTVARAQVTGPEIVDQSAGRAGNWQVVFGASGKWIASWGDSNVKIFDLGTGQVARTVAVTGATHLIAHPTKDVIAIAGSGGISAINVVRGETLWRAEKNTTLKCGPIQYSADGARVHGGCSGPNAAYLKTWDADTGLELGSTPLPEDTKMVSAFSPDGEWFAAPRMLGSKELISMTKSPSADMEFEHRIFETRTGRQIGSLRTFMLLGLSSKTHRAIGTLLRGLTLHYVDDGSRRVIGLAQGASWASISRDGTRALLIGTTLRIVELATGNVTPVQVSDASEAMSATFAADNDQVAVIGMKQPDRILMFSLANPQLRRIIGTQGSETAAIDALKKKLVERGLGDPNQPFAETKTEKGERKQTRKRTDRATRAKGAERQRLLEEADAVWTQQTQDVSKFGVPSAVPAAAALLDSGRLLAVRSADAGWNIWDTTTGNQLPFRRPPGDLKKYSTSESFLNREELREFEASVTGRGSTPSVAEAPANRTACYSLTEESCRLFLLSIPSSGGLPLGFSPDSLTLITAIGSPTSPYIDVYGLRLWDAVELRKGGLPRPVELPDAVASLKLALFHPNGRVFMAPDSSRALGIWDRRSGDRLGTLRAFQEGEWLVTTPQGLFDGSPRGWTTMAWRDSKTDLATKPLEIFFNEFYRPGLLADLIEGRRPQGPRSIPDVDRRQPKVSLGSQSAETAEPTATLDIVVEEAPASDANPMPGGVRDLRLFRNGSLAKVWRGDLNLTSGRATIRAVVPLVAGENRFVTYAFNGDNVKSADAVAVVRSAAAPKPATAYVIAIGINRYANPAFNLAFAAADARRLSELLGQRYGELGRFNKIVQVGLYDDQATRANVLLALGRLAGKAESLPAGAPSQLRNVNAVQPQDGVVIYFAGHGVASGDRFYLVPHDLNYTGSRADLPGSLQRVLDAGISDQDLERAFEEIDASNPILIIDACSSGKALDTEEQRRGPLNSKGLAQLAYEKGMYVLTASQAYQAALESSKLGHGYLTFALVEEALNSPAADVSPNDNEVTVRELFDYAVRRVPQLQIEALDKASLDSRVLTYDDSAPRAGAPGRLQTPRLYYRRDDSGPAPVVWKRK